MPLLPHLQLTTTLNTTDASHLPPHCPICLDLAHRPHQLCPYLLEMWKLDAELQELQKARIIPLSVRPLMLWNWYARTSMRSYVSSCLRLSIRLCLVTRDS